MPPDSNVFMVDFGPLTQPDAQFIAVPGKTGEMRQSFRTTVLRRRWPWCVNAAGYSDGVSTPALTEEIIREMHKHCLAPITKVMPFPLNPPPAWSATPQATLSPDGRQRAGTNRQPIRRSPETYAFIPTASM